MLTNKQEQTAGDYSQQYQSQSMTINNNGLTAQDAIEIFQSITPMILAQYKDEAIRIAEERVKRLEEKLIPMLEQTAGALENFKDPAFQLQLRRAQMSAAVSDADADLDMLSQLMIKHTQVKEDRIKIVGVKKAIEIVSEIDNKALFALTVLYVLLHLHPTLPRASNGLEELERLYSKILYTTLPEGNEWISHLDILGTIMIYQYSDKIRLENICESLYPGYSAAGIKKGSDRYLQASTLLSSIHFGESFLIDNPIMDGYCILPVVSKERIKYLTVVAVDQKTKMIKSRTVNDDEINMLLKIWDLYETGESADVAKRNFIRMWDSYPNLHKVHDWLQNIPVRIDLNIVGMILAQTSIKRYDPTIPDVYK